MGPCTAQASGHAQLKLRPLAARPARRHRLRVQSAVRELLGSLLPGRSGVQEKRCFKDSELVKLGPLKVSPMGLGTWAWGNQLLWGYDDSQDMELEAVFNLAVSRGINLFDTADSYGAPSMTETAVPCQSQRCCRRSQYFLRLCLCTGTGALNGRSEQLLGDFVRRYPGSQRTRAGVRIATKLAPYPWRLTGGQFVAACRGSLRRLGAEQLAIGQLHWSTANYQPLQERAQWDGLVRMYDEGLVQAVGVSNFGPKQLARIAAYLERRGVPLVTAQVQFSLVSRGPEQQAVLAACRDLGLQLISYSPLGLGMLSGKYGGPGGALPRGPRALLFRQILPGLEPLLAEMRAVAAARQKSVPQVAINWCLSRGTIPIPGARSLQQLEEALGALGWRLSEQEVAALEAAADRAPRTMLQNVFQTR